MIYSPIFCYLHSNVISPPIIIAYLGSLSASPYVAEGHISHCNNNNDVFFSLSLTNHLFLRAIVT